MPLYLESLIPEQIQRRAPPEPGTERRVWCGGRPRAVRSRQQLVDRLTRHIVVDQGFGEPLCEVRWTIDVERAPRQGQGARTALVEQHPRAASTQFVTCAVDDQPARRQSRTQSLPRRCNRRFRILAQNVERTDQCRTQACQFEAPRANSTPFRPGTTRSGSISRPTTRRSGRTVRRRAAHSRVVTGIAP